MSFMWSELNRRTTFSIVHDAMLSTKAHIVIFSLSYVFFGFVVVMTRPGCYQQWPLFMKRAVARSGDLFETGRRRRKRGNTGHGYGEGNWVELDGVELDDDFFKATKDGGTGKVATAGDSVKAPKSVHFATGTVEHVEAAHNKDLERGLNTQKVEGSTLDKGKDIHADCPSIKEMRKSGLLVVGAAMFLLLIFWPLQVIWFLVWLIIYNVWEIHYIRISTRRARAVARAHRQRNFPKGKPVVVVSKIAFIMESPIRGEADRSKPSENPDGPTLEDENTTTRDTTAAQENSKTFQSVMTYPGFKTLYLLLGRVSQAIKAFLAYKDIAPAPEFCSRRMLSAEKKRQDILDDAAGLVVPGPTSATGRGVAPPTQTK